MKGAFFTATFTATKIKFRFSIYKISQTHLKKQSAKNFFAISSQKNDITGIKKNDFLIFKNWGCILCNFACIMLAVITYLLNRCSQDFVSSANNRKFISRKGTLPNFEQRKNLEMTILRRRCFECITLRF